MDDKEWEEFCDDVCYECTGYGDDYYYDNEADELVCRCSGCPYYSFRVDDD